MEIRAKMWLTILLVLISVFIGWVKWNYSYFKIHKIQGPNPTFPVGNIGVNFTLKKHFGEAVTEWYNKYYDQPYFGYFKCFTPSLVLRDPDIIKDVLIKDYLSFNENDLGFDENQDPLLAQNPFVTTGEKWKQSRALLSPLFTSGKMKTLFPLMESSLDTMSEFVGRKGKDFDFDAKDLASRYTTENVVKVAFSLPAEAFVDGKESEFRVMGKKMFEPTTAVVIKLTIMFFIPAIMKIFPLS